MNYAANDKKTEVKNAERMPSAGFETGTIHACHNSFPRPVPQHLNYFPLEEWDNCICHLHKRNRDCRLC